MAIEPISADASFVYPTAAVARIEGSLVRFTERTLAEEVLLSDSVDLSDPGRLLSAVSEIAEAANTAAQGGAIDPREVASDAQRFVDSVNALNLTSQFETGGLFANASEPSALPLTTGLNAVPLADEAGGFVLTLDNDALQTALETAPVETSSALASAVVPLGNALAVQATDVDLSAAPQAGSLFQAETVVEPAPVLAVSPASEPVAPAEVSPPPAQSGSAPLVRDLTESNAELRQALADRLLADAFNPAQLLSPVANPVATLPPLPEVVLPEVDNTLAVPTTVSAPAQFASADAAAQLDEPQAAPPATTPGQGAGVNPGAEPASESAAAAGAGAAVSAANSVSSAAAATGDVQVTLTAEELITTPLEQITRLALNPTVAGAVAAFQIVGDEGARASRVSPAADAEQVNPVAAVGGTEAVSARLASGSEQRHDYPANARVSEWLATRPGLV